eukprot:3295132-Rhodomonas_salina.7
MTYCMLLQRRVSPYKPPYRTLLTGLAGHYSVTYAPLSAYALATRCPVGYGSGTENHPLGTILPISLRACYGMSGTDELYGTTRSLLGRDFVREENHRYKPLAAYARAMPPPVLAQPRRWYLPTRVLCSAWYWSSP